MAYCFMYIKEPIVLQTFGFTFSNYVQLEMQLLLCAVHFAKPRNFLEFDINVNSLFNMTKPNLIFAFSCFKA